MQLQNILDNSPRYVRLITARIFRLQDEMTGLGNDSGESIRGLEPDGVNLYDIILHSARLIWVAGCLAAMYLGHSAVGTSMLLVAFLLEMRLRLRD